MPPPTLLSLYASCVRDSWFDSECTDEEYMVNFSGRYHELHGVRVRTDTPGNFMDDLKKYGYIKG